MRLLFLLIGLGIRIVGLPIRLVLSTSRTIYRLLSRLRPVAQIGLYFMVLVKNNRIASVAIILSAINFGLLMWQIWPDDPVQTITVLSQPAPISETVDLDNTSGRITELENQIRDLSREQQFQFDRLIDCINFPSPFGCPRHIPAP